MTLRFLARRVPWAALLPAFVATWSIVNGVRAGIARSPEQGKLIFAIQAVLPVVMGVGMWIMLFLRPAVSGRLTALLMSLGVALVGVELGVRAVIPAEYPDYFARAKAAYAKGIVFDRRSQVEVALDMRRAGTLTYTVPTPASIVWQTESGLYKSGVEIDGRETVPLGGVARAHTLGANESGKQVEYVSDEMGFNNPPGLWGTGPVDVLLLGDSFTTGWGVAPEHNTAAPIRARWPRTLNLGLTGAGPLLELGDLREFGGILRPKVVIWLYYEGNDMIDLQRERRMLIWNYLTPGFTQDLWARRDDVNRALATFLDRRIEATGQWWTTPADVIRLRRVRALTKGKTARYVPRPADFAHFSRVLAEAKRAVMAWGGQILFVYLPSWGRFAVPAEATALDHDRAYVVAAALSEGILIVDGAEIFKAGGDPLDNFPYGLHGHYNERGYERIGRALVDRLAESSLLGP